MKATTHDTGRRASSSQSKQCCKKSRMGSTGRTFVPEALAPCLADLKMQLALRQAMP